MSNLLNLMIFIVGTSMNNPIEIEDGKFKGIELSSKFDKKVEESNVEVIDYDKLIMEMTEKANDEYEELKNEQYMILEATYYSAFCKTCSGHGITASGISVANTIYYKGFRVVATNENEIPMWSIVEVITPYEKFEAVALDTGGFGLQAIDILVDSTQTAYRLGRHAVKVKIIGSLK